MGSNGKDELKTFSTCNKNIKWDLNQKVVKLREDTTLLVRFLVIQQCCPELGATLTEAICHYKISVVPCSLFISD